MTRSSLAQIEKNIKSNLKNKLSLTAGIIISLLLTGCNGGGGSSSISIPPIINVPNVPVIPPTEIGPSKPIVPPTEIGPSKPIVPPTEIGPSKPIVPPTEIGPSKPIVPPTEIGPSIPPIRIEKIENILIDGKDRELKYYVDQSGKVLDKDISIDGIAIDIIDKNSIKIIGDSPFKDVIIVDNGNEMSFSKTNETTKLIIDKKTKIGKIKKGNVEYIISINDKKVTAKENINISNKEYFLEYEVDIFGKAKSNTILLNGEKVKIDKENKSLEFLEENYNGLNISAPNFASTNYGDTYIIKFDGNRYHYFDNKHVLNITNIIKIVNAPNFTSEKLEKELSGQFLEDYKRGKNEKIAISNFGEIHNGQINNDTKHYLYNYGKIKLDLKEASIGQHIKNAGYAFNYGLIEINSDENAIGQYIDYTYNVSTNLGAYNYGKIQLKSDSKNSFIKGHQINGSGIYLKNSYSLGEATAHNYGIIEIDNTSYDKEANPYYSVGMIADGNKSTVFNYGQIIVDGGPEDQVFMKGINGGKVFNYGDFIYKGKNLILGNLYSYSNSKYTSDNNVVIDKEINIIPETSKGDFYIKESFITASGEITGINNIVSQGVYSVKTIEREKDGNKIIDLQLNKTKNIEDTVEEDLSNLIKESKLDDLVYYKENSNFTKHINQLVSSGETWKLADLYALEYINLNGSILENSKIIGANYKKLSSSEEINIFGDLNKNFTGIFSEEAIGNYRLGVFKDSKKDFNLGAGMDYDRESTSVLISKTLNKNSNILLGYQNSENRYESSSKLESNNFIFGGQYTSPLNSESINYNFSTEVNLGFNNMNRENSSDRFKSYSFSFYNSLNKEINIPIFNLGKAELGIRTTVFGHDKIQETSKDLNTSRNITIDEKLNLSNIFMTNFEIEKTFNLFQTPDLVKLNMGINYEKELMNVEKWSDSVKLTDLETASYSETIKNEKYGKIDVFAGVDLKLNDNYLTGLYIKTDSLGYEEVGIDLKITL